jgi:hypothetical protein
MINSIEEIQRIVKLIESSKIYNERVLITNLYELVDSQQLIFANG